MMKIFLLLCCLHMTMSAPADTDQGNAKVDYEVDLDGKGKITFESDLNPPSYSYRAETDDGTIKHEKGHLEDEENMVAEGGYEYVGENGVKFSVVYVADKNGFRPMVTFGTKGGSSGGAPHSARAISPAALENVASEASATENEPEVETESQQLENI